MVNYIRKRTNSEEGNSMFILYLGMFIVLMGFFGLAVDSAIAVNSRSQAQASLDSAVVGATRLTILNTDTINPEHARSEVEAVYTVNRQNAPGVKCATAADTTRHPGTVLKGTGGCRWLQREFSTQTGAQNAVTSGGRITTGSLKMTVVECVPTIFLTPIKPENCFTLTTTSRAANSLETR